MPTYLPPDQLPQPPAATKLSPAAAASGAAFAVLSSIYSNQSAAINAAALATRAALRRNGDTAFDKLFEPSYEYGQRVGKAVIDLRQDDPTSNITERLDIPGLPSNGGYRPPLYDGGYRPARGSNSATVYAPRYGAATPLFATGRRYSLREPSEFTRGNDVFKSDAEYLSWKGVEEAQLPDVPEDRRRTAEETNTGIFWAYDGPRRLGTPPRLYNQVCDGVCVTGQKSSDLSLRLSLSDCQTYSRMRYTFPSLSYKVNLTQISVRFTRPSLKPPLPGRALRCLIH